MDRFDPAAERKVWQRVQSTGGQIQREDLRGLILSAQEAAADYRFLMGQLKGTAADQAKKLWEGAQETVACLKGLQQLRAVQPRRIVSPPKQQQSVRRVLESSYHRCRRMAGEYTARSADGECGFVFMRLAQREQENCVRIAALLGQTGEK